jgi:hypothetical protein
MKRIRRERGFTSETFIAGILPKKKGGPFSGPSFEIAAQFFAPLKMCGAT